MSKSGLEVVAHDKDGGYSLVDPEVLTYIQPSIVGERPVFLRQTSQSGTNVVRKPRCRTPPSATRVGDLEQEPELARALCKSLSVPGAAIEVQLVTSCKSHKPPGAVKFRNIHSAPRHAFAGLAMWSTKQHREQLQQFPTLHRDTRDFNHNISDLKALLEHHFVRLDIEEFVHEWRSRNMACDAAGLSEEGPRKRLLREVVRFLLNHQFVATKRHP